MKQKATVILLLFLMYLPAGFAFDFKLESAKEKKSILSLTDHEQITPVKLKLDAAMSPGDGKYGAGIMSGFVSLAAPGVGLYMANRKLVSLAFLPICYGMVGGGVGLMMKGAKDARNNYDLYLAEKSPSQQTTYLELADDSKLVIARGKSILIGGIAVWGLQAAWTFIYGRYNDFYRARDSKWKNQQAFFNGGYDFNTKTTSINMTLKF